MFQLSEVPRFSSKFDRSGPTAGIRARGPSVTFDVVQVHRSQGQEHLLQLIAKVIGQFSGTSDADVAARTELLTPIMRQQNAIASYLRGHRPIPDVDPDSGEETNESQVDPVPAHSHTVTLTDTDG